MRQLRFRAFHPSILLVLMLSALVLRVVWVWKVHTFPVYDFYKYHLGALSVAQGEGYKLFGNYTAFEPIGYPGFLAILYKVIAPRIIVPKLFNIFFGLASIGLTYLIGKRLFGIGVGLLAAAMIAFSPRNITYTSVLSTEHFFTFFLLLSVYLYLYFKKEKWTPFALGIISGILALTKPFMLLFPGVLFLFYWLESKKFTFSLKKAIVIGIFMALTIAPWTIRNYIVFKEFIPISTNGGITMYLNNNPYANGHWQDPFKFPNSPLKPYKNEETGFWDELAVDKLGKKLAREWILSNPKEFFMLGFKKVYYVFNDAWDVEYAVQELTNGKPLPNRWWLFDVARGAYFSLLGLLCLYPISLALSFLRENSSKLSVHLYPWLIIFFFTGINFIFEGQPRYLFPLLPLLAMLASFGLVKLGNIFFSRSK